MHEHLLLFYDCKPLAICNNNFSFLCFLRAAMVVCVRSMLYAFAFCAIFIETFRFSVQNNYSIFGNVLSDPALFCIAHATPVYASTHCPSN